MLARYDGTSNGRALLAGLDGHFANHFFDEQVKFFIIGGDVIGQDGAVQRVGFSVEGNAAANQVGVHAQFGGRVGRACESDHIGHIQSVKQVARAANHQLQCAFGQDARLVNHANQGFCQIAGGCGGLADARHAGQEGGRKFLQQAPYGKVESIDVNCNTATRYQDVRASKGVFLTQRGNRAFVN